MASHKNIVFVLPNLGGGGAETVFLTLANEISKITNVHLVVIDFKGELKDSVSGNVIIHNLNIQRVRSSILKLVKLFRALNPIAIYTTMIYCNTVVSLAHFISRTKANLIIREATTPSLVLQQSSIFYRKLIGWTYRRANFVIAGSQGVEIDLKSLFNLSNIKEISNPIISQKLNLLSKENCNHKFFSQDAPVILTVGKVSPAKDYITLLKAFHRLLKKRDARLLIIGKTMKDTSYAKEVVGTIKALEIEDKVDFKGFDINPFKYMLKAQLFVLSSIREGSPGALIQALYINGNVISTDCKSGPKEILLNGKYGRLVPVSNYEALADAMDAQLDNPLINPNRFDGLSKFYVETAVLKYLSLSGINLA